MITWYYYYYCTLYCIITNRIAGTLGTGIHSITNDFLQHLLDIDSLPPHSACISHLHTQNGGLGLLFPRHQATTDYVITMTSAIQRATNGFQPNTDVTPTRLHSSITNLFDVTTNPQSQCLAHYHVLLPPIANIACPERCPPHERTHHFQTNLSPHSIRSNLKKHCTNLLTDLTYKTTILTAPTKHAYLLPSILNPQTSYPLIAMNRSNPNNRLLNWSFLYAIRRKL